MTEIWLPIPKWEGFYEVSNLGRARSVARLVLHRSRSGNMVWGKRGGTMLVPTMGTTGYLRLTLSNLPRRGHVKLHIAVAAAFLGTRPQGHDVAHLDGDPTNCVASNLVYATRKQNMAHAIEHDTIKHGEGCHLSKLSAATVIDIVSRRKMGETMSAIAKTCGTSQPNISKIMAGGSWGRITGIAQAGTCA